MHPFTVEWKIWISVQNNIHLPFHFNNIGASATQAKPRILSSGQKFTPSLKDFAGPKNVSNIKVGFTSTLPGRRIRAEHTYGASITKARTLGAANSSGEGDVLDSIHVHRVRGHRALLAVKVVINNSLLCYFRRVGASTSQPHATLWHTSLLFVRKYLGICRGHRGHVHPFTSKHCCCYLVKGLDYSMDFTGFASSLS